MPHRLQWQTCGLLNYLVITQERVRHSVLKAQLRSKDLKKIQDMVSVDCRLSKSEIVKDKEI